MPIAALGWLNPRSAGPAMALSSLSVIANCFLLPRIRMSGTGRAILGLFNWHGCASQRQEGLRFNAQSRAGIAAFITCKEATESVMNSHQITGHDEDYSTSPESSEGYPPEGMFPLHRLSSICCSTGECHHVDSWPMGLAQEGWLQLNPAEDDAVPVDLIAFSSRGVSVILKADASLQQGSCARLVTQAHGAGLSHRTVRICWHRPHPQDPERQCVGLRFTCNALS